MLFRQNRQLRNPQEIQLRLTEAEARLTMAEHYKNPYPRYRPLYVLLCFLSGVFGRPVNLPKTSFSKREGKKVGKAIQRKNEQSRPVYIRSTDDTVLSKTE